MPGLFELPVGVAKQGDPGSGYRVTIYMPGRATVITSVANFYQVMDEIDWVLARIYRIFYTNIFEVKIHRETL